MTRPNREIQSLLKPIGNLPQAVSSEIDPQIGTAFRQRIAVLMLSLATCLTATGCRLCCDSEDAAYAAYGGAWQRTQRNTGRVGSLSEPAGVRVDNLSPRDESGSALRSPLRAKGDESEDTNDEDGTDPKVESVPPNVQDDGKSQEERDREFQEKLRKFEENQMENDNIIPGNPSPPDLSLR